LADVTVKRWEKKRVVVLGIARQGKALARYLTNEGAMVVMSDIKTEEELGPAIEELSDLELSYALGGHPVKLLDGTEALFLSGGVPTHLPIVQEARTRNIPVLNDAQIFIENCPADVIGITGSAGKTTTTTLVFEMLKLAMEGTDRRAWLGGNIGRSLLEDLESMNAQDVVVMELSSFQLELMTVSPRIAALLNITPDHLDRHGSMEIYTEAKRQILTSQDETGKVVLGFDDPRTWALRNQAQGEVIAFGYGAPDAGNATYVDDGNLVLRLEDHIQVICRVEDLALRGPHNVLNVLAACALGSIVQIGVDAMATVAKTFRGVPHRLEFIRQVLGAAWYNDSIATTPDRALAAVRSFEEPLVVMVGGRDKELTWDVYVAEVAKRAKAVVLFGEARHMLQDVFQTRFKREDAPELYLVKNFEQAFQKATEVVQPGDVVLLSPGCTSYDEFQNFEARGERYKEMVSTL
jgi:UDP-N-acetylmuramoylalanine--D-glutamate ligase